MSGPRCGLDGCPGEVMADGFCDTCGRQPAKTARFSAITSVATSESFDDPPCPGCGAARDLEALFCEACGFDFVKGKAPSAPVARPSSTGDVSKTPKAPVPGPRSAAASSTTPPAATDPTVTRPQPAEGDDGASIATSQGEDEGDDADAETKAADSGALAPAPEASDPGEQTWEAVVETDAVWYARFCETWKTSHGDDCPIPFPGDFTRTQMIGGPVVVIGRHAAGIDLAKDPNDAAVSHRHASLIRQPDGSYALTDLDSSNGTYVDEGPIAKGQTTTIAHGESFTVGAFTRITLNFIGD